MQWHLLTCLTRPTLPLHCEGAWTLRAAGDPTRDKCIAILAHALTPADALSPAEAAVRLEAELFAAYGTPGKPADPCAPMGGGSEAPGAQPLAADRLKLGSANGDGGANGATGGGGGGGREAGGRCGARYKRRARLLWGLLAPDSAACLPELRQRLLRGAPSPATLDAVALCSRPA